MTHWGVHWDKGNGPSASEWVDYFLSLSREKQIEKAGVILSAMDDASKCFINDHKGRLEYYEEKYGFLK